MPISYTQSSSSQPSIESGGARAYGDFGVPNKCWCGERMKLEVLDWGQNQEDGKEHRSKWWDDAVDEELEHLDIKICRQTESIHQAYQNPMLESIRETMRIMRDENEELNARLTHADCEIGRLRELLRKW
ncbi:PREDICTED: uncharacterized protein At4g04775-like [Camelina sativa]|uniref:Uncharacterized protein At4g04775-like n=1 Tax=Camelina sativa TaxID=90675 RepID=A0ABM0USP3_CAMSA|nr:PREDICTED: uncharacterized protein At4g04775-like [Camelina sativa]